MHKYVTMDEAVNAAKAYVEMYPEIPYEQALMRFIQLGQMANKLVDEGYTREELAEAVLEVDGDSYN